MHISRACVEKSSVSDKPPSSLLRAITYVHIHTVGDARNCSPNAHICFLEYYTFHLMIDNFLQTLAKQNFPETLERLKDACAFVEHFLASPLLYNIRSLYSHKYDCSRDGELGSLLTGSCPTHIKTQDTINYQCL